ncbi:MAG: DoxX-like family protein [Leptospira bouyouniensis]
MNFGKILFFFKLGVAIIFLQTLFFKFNAADESIFIFTKLGVEPWGRIAMGILELMIVIFLFIPFLVWLGALFGIGSMMGAILAHIFVIGINVANDHGLLFVLAIVNFLGCSYILYSEKENLLMNMQWLFKRK